MSELISIYLLGLIYETLFGPLIAVVVWFGLLTISVIRILYRNRAKSKKQKAKM